MTPPLRGPRIQRVVVVVLGAALLVVGVFSVRILINLNPIPEFADEVVIPDDGVMGLCATADGTLYFVDYFEGTLGILDPENRELQVLASGLTAPAKIAASGTDLYFTETGTQGQRYRDGKLSVFDTRTGQHRELVGALQYPTSVFVERSGSILVIECAGSSTSYPGHDRLIRVDPETGKLVVVIPKIPAPQAVVADRRGTIYVGTMGRSSPGNTATLLAYRPGRTEPEVLASELPTIHDLWIDGKSNLYIAGFGRDENTGVVFLRSGTKEIVPLIDGHQVNCLALDPGGNVFYSSGRRKDAIRVLRRTN